MPEPRQYGRSAGRHTEGISVSELVLRDDTGALPTTGAVITAGGRLRRHANPLSVARGSAATRVTTAAVLVGGTAVGVIGAVAGPAFVPPVDDSPLHSPEAAPGGLVPVPGIPGQVTGAPQIIAFSTSAESLGLTGGAPGGARTGTSSLPGAPGAPVPGVSAPGTRGPVTGGGSGAGGGIANPQVPPVQVPPVQVPGGNNPGGSNPGGPTPTPAVDIVTGVVVDAGGTVGPLLPGPLPPLVTGTTDAVGGLVGGVQETVVAPVGGLVGGTTDAVGSAASGLPVVGGTVDGLTDTVSDVTTIVTGGGAAPSGPGVAGAAGTLLTDVGSTVGTVAPPLAGPVQLTTSTAADFVARTTGTVTAPVTSTLDTVGSATEDVPAVGPTLRRTTDTAGAVVGTLLNGAERSTSSDDSPASESSGDDSSDDASSSSDASSADESDDPGSSDGQSDESDSSDEGAGDLVSDTAGTVTGLLGR